MIRLENISKAFDGKVILNGISTCFLDGKVTTIIGPSGTGKSTLIRLINRLEDLDSGNIYYNDKNIYLKPRLFYHPYGLRAIFLD